MAFAHPAKMRFYMVEIRQMRSETQDFTLSLCPFSWLYARGTYPRTCYAREPLGR